MSTKENLKILGMLIVLGLALVVMKLLSEFEYEVRKNRSEYYVVWEEDFEAAELDTIWSTSDPDIAFKISDGTLSINPSQDLDILSVKPPFSPDSMYLELKLKWPDNKLYTSSIDLVELGGSKVTLFSNEQSTTSFTTIISDKFYCENCHHINLSITALNPNGFKNSDSPWQIDKITLYKKKVQEKLF